MGGDKGLLKILKMAEPKRGEKPKKPLSLNMTLESHEGNITCIRWNEQYHKLTTSND